MGKDGFTLLELLVVITIVGIFAGMMFMMPRDTYAVRAAANTLSNQVVRARMEALRRNEYVGIRIDKAASQFFLFEDRNRDLTFSTGDVAIESTRTTLPSSEYPSTQFGTSLVSGGYNFVFDTRGIPRTLSAMSVPFSSRSGKYTKTVSVTSQGRPSIQ